METRTCKERATGGREQVGKPLSQMVANGVILPMGVLHTSVSVGECTEFKSHLKPQFIEDKFCKFIVENGDSRVKVVRPVMCWLGSGLKKFQLKARRAGLNSLIERQVRATKSQPCEPLVSAPTTEELKA